MPRGIPCFIRERRGAFCMRPSGKLTVFGGISGCSKSRKSRLARRRCANIRRRSEAKHCSSLCLQSEGERILWRPNTAKNPTKSCPKALAIFATCSWPSLCKQSELQCWRRNRRLHLSLRRKTTDSLLVSERGTRTTARGTRHDRTQGDVWSCFVPRSLTSIGNGTKSVIPFLLHVAARD